MRLRSLALASTASALALAVPAGANAAHVHGPHHNHGLTIAATPNPIIAGEGVMIYGQLGGSSISGQAIKLYHRIAPNRHYTLVGSTTTNAEGFYEFTRAEGVVNTNRSWYVRAPGVSGHAHSRTVFERVAAEVSLDASATSADTRTPITFSGTVAPNHAGGRVSLQVETGALGQGWKTVAHGRIVAGSTYSIPYRFRSPGDRDVRVLFAGDRRNTAAASDPVTVSIQQAQVADFTIRSSAQTITYGGASATLTGVLYNAGTTTPDAGVSVRLWARTAHHGWRTAQIPVNTGTAGGYSFTVKPSVNTVYEVRTTTPGRSTAPLYLGVHDVVSMTPSTTTTDVGQRVHFTGTVSPDKAGSTAYLERLGADGHWHVVEVRTITHASNFTFGWVFGHAGTAEFRVRVASDPTTLGGVSPAATVTVALPPVSALPTAS